MQCRKSNERNFEKSCTFGRRNRIEGLSQRNLKNSKSNRFLEKLLSYRLLVNLNLNRPHSKKCKVEWIFINNLWFLLPAFAEKVENLFRKFRKFKVSKGFSKTLLSRLARLRSTNSHSTDCEVKKIVSTSVSELLPVIAGKVSLEDFQYLKKKFSEAFSLKSIGKIASFWWCFKRFWGRKNLEPFLRC